MVKVGININKKKPKTLDAYTPEFYEFREMLDFKCEGWEEFVLTTKNNRINLRFVKKGQEIVEFKKNLDLMRLTVYLDKKFPKWERFTISNTTYPIIPCPDCEEGMVIRLSDSNAHSYVLVEGHERDASGKITQVIGNQEGEKIIFKTTGRKKYKFSVLMKEMEQNSKDNLFGKILDEVNS